MIRPTRGEEGHIPSGNPPEREEFQERIADVYAATPKGPFTLIKESAIRPLARAASALYQGLSALLFRDNAPADPPAPAVPEEPIPEFEDTSPGWKDPPCVRRLTFLTSNLFVAQGDLIVGVHDDQLLAYQQMGDQLAWRMIRGAPSWLSATSLGIAFTFPNCAQLHLLHPETLRLTDVTLPAVPIQFYITPKGFCYFVTADQELWGGSWQSGIWKTAFKKPVSLEASFLPAGECLCIRYFLNPMHARIDCQGKKHKLAYDHGFVAGNGRWVRLCYQGYFLVMTYSEGNVEDVQTAIVNERQVALKGVCRDGSVICFAGNQILFIDVENEQIIKVPCDLPAGYGKVFIDEERGAVWTWNELTQLLKKHTKEGSQDMGHLSGGRGMHFHHVDKNDRLYFSYHPY